MKSPTPRPSSPKGARKRKPVESPRNPFDAAKLITKALRYMYGDDRERALRWAIEKEFGAYPIKIVKGTP